jgi:hypothetical protein
MELLEVSSMKRVVFFLFVLGTAWPVYGQSQTQAGSQPPSAADTSQTAPPKTQAATKPKPARVWNNDQVGKLPDADGVMVAGDDTDAKRTDAIAQKAASEENAARYRRQLAPLRLDIAKIDVQIAKLHNFLSGEHVNEPPPQYPGLSANPQDQLKQLEKRRAADAAKISDLEERARYDGILPGALR